MQQDFFKFFPFFLIIINYFLFTGGFTPITLIVSDDDINLPDASNWKATNSPRLRLVISLVEQLGEIIELTKQRRNKMYHNNP